MQKRKGVPFFFTIIKISVISKKVFNKATYGNVFFQNQYAGNHIMWSDHGIFYFFLQGVSRSKCPIFPALSNTRW
jgi:hypothetical protein